jgi:hypothetical protein
VITTATITTGIFTSVSGANGVFATKLVIPSTAYTGSAPAQVGIYATGGYLIVGDAGAWASTALA